MLWELNCIGWRAIFFIYKTKLLGLFMWFISNLFLLKVLFISKNTRGWWILCQNQYIWDILLGYFFRFFFQSNQFCAKELVKALCVYMYNWTHLIAFTRIWILSKNAEGCQPVFLWLLLSRLCPLVWCILPSYFAEANYLKGRNPGRFDKSLVMINTVCTQKLTFEICL